MLSTNLNNYNHADNNDYTVTVCRDHHGYYCKGNDRSFVIFGPSDKLLSAVKFKIPIIARKDEHGCFNFVRPSNCIDVINYANSIKN